MRLFIFILISAFLFSYHPLGAEDVHSLGLLLDVSKSVSPEEFQEIKTQLAALIRESSPSVNISLYTFGTSLKKITRESLASIEATETNTIFYDALFDVMQDLQKERSFRKSILIISDGKDTKSATVLEDVVSRAQEQKIVIHSVPMGRADHRLLERLAKLTGGKYFVAKNAALVKEIVSTIDIKPRSNRMIAAGRPSVTPKSNSPTAEASSEPITTSVSGGKSWWIVIAVASGLLVGSGAFLRHRHVRKRLCTTCGRPLESTEFTCSECPGQTIIQTVSAVVESSPVHIPPVTLQTGQETQELLARTHFIDTTPSLVITKGDNIGERYRLSKTNPISIGRSRTNEIRTDDPSVSAQHCRIIPENGEYVVYDLGSTNGTVVNNIHVNMAVLEEGDTIRVGSTTLLFTITEA